MLPAPESLLKVYQSYAVDPRNRISIRNLRTALRRHVLSRYGFSESQLKRGNLDACMDLVTLGQFVQDFPALIDELEHLERSVKYEKNAATTYRSALQRFFTWVCSQGWHDYSQIPEIDLVEAQSFAADHADLRFRFLSHEQRVSIVSHLRKYCGDPDECEKLDPNSKGGVIRSWENYLILALLTYTPLRQGQISRLKFGESLIRDPKSGYVARFANLPGEIVRIPDHLTDDLDIWMNKLRSTLPSNEGIVFVTQKSVKSEIEYPFSSGRLSDLVADVVRKAVAYLNLSR